MVTKQKVIAYIYRIINGKIEVLVFDHRDFPEAGTQVVGGTVENGEDFSQAMVREIAEESGIIIAANALISIGDTVYFRKDKNEQNLRRYYKVRLEHLSEKFNHTVISAGEDNELVFSFYWLDIDSAKLKLTGQFGELLDSLL